jgi:hypothetical protein
VKTSGSWLLSVVIHAALLIGATLPVVLGYAADRRGADRDRFHCGFSPSIQRVAPIDRHPEVMKYWSDHFFTSDGRDPPSLNADAPSPRREHAPDGCEECGGCPDIIPSPLPPNPLQSYFARVQDGEFRKRGLFGCCRRGRKPFPVRRFGCICRRDHCLDGLLRPFQQ